MLPLPVVRRTPFSLPYPDVVSDLCALLAQAPVPRPLDPERFERAVTHHRVEGYAVGAGVDPTGRLADVIAIRATRAALLRAELGSALAQLDCDPVLLKGPAVADRFYPTRSLRTFGDLDLLLPGDRLRDAVTALAPRGYRPLEEFRPGFAERHGHDVHVERRLGAHTLDLELHWRIGDDPVSAALDHRRLRASAQRIDVAGHDVLVPGIHHQL